MFFDVLFSSLPEAGDALGGGGDSLLLSAITVVQNFPRGPARFGDKAFRITDPETVRFIPVLGSGGGSRGSLCGAGSVLPLKLLFPFALPPF